MIMQNITRYTMVEEYCELGLPTHYELFWAIAFISLTLVGLFYAIFGYRCWRLTIFIPPFGIASAILYMLISIPKTLDETLVILIACLLAILFGLVSALVPNIGLFILGSCFGLIISIITFIICDIRNRLNGVTTSFWLVFGLTIILGLICAISTLRFQKFMLIIISSCLAGVCHMLVLDYFLQLSVLLRFIHDRLLILQTSNLCVRHWIIVLILPIIMLFGIVIQYTCTGRNYDHRDSWHRFLSAGKKRYTANLKKIRNDYEQDTIRQQTNPDESNRFRYLYHKRRANGDVLSSDFMQNVRQQNSNAVRLTSVNNNNNNVIPTATIETTPTQKDNDSATTTLTHLI